MTVTAPTFVAVGAQSTASATTITPALPAGTAQGDVAYAFFTYRNNGTKSISSGWTLIIENQFTSTHWAGLYRRVLQTGDTAPTLTVSISDNLGGEVSAWRGADQSSPEDATTVTQGFSAAASNASKRIRTNTNTTTVVAFASTSQVNALALHAGSSYTLAYGGASYDATGFGSHGAAYITQATAGNSLTATFDQTTGTNGNWVFFTVALRAAPAVSAAATIASALQTAPASDAGVQVFSGGGNTVRFVAQVLTPFAPGARLWCDGTSVTTPKYDDGTTWAGVGNWVDVTTRVRGAIWTRGREDPAGRWRVGTAALTMDNTDGYLSPWNTDGPYTFAGTSYIRGNLLVRVGFLVTGVWEPAFSGLLDSIDDNTESNTDGFVNFTVVETLSTIAGYNVSERPAQGAGDTLSERLQRLLNDAGWPYGLTVDAAADPASFAQSVTMFEDTTMAQDRLGDVYLAVDSWVGFIGGVDARLMEIRSDRDGVAVAQRYQTDADIPGSPAHFSNDPVTYTPAWPMVDAKPYCNTERVVNIASLQGPAGTDLSDPPVVTRDDTSVDLLGPQTLTRTDLICEAAGYAYIGEALVTRAFDDLGIETVNLNVDMDPTNLWPYLAAFDLNLCLDVDYVHPSGEVLSEVLWVDAYTMQFVPIGPGDATLTAEVSTRLANLRSAP